jgi:hypothetical protein
MSLPGVRRAKAALTSGCKPAAKESFAVAVATRAVGRLPAHTNDRFYEDSFVIALGKAQERGI